MNIIKARNEGKEICFFHFHYQCIDQIACAEILSSLEIYSCICLDLPYFFVVFVMLGNIK